MIHFNFGLHDLKYLDAQGKYVSPEQGQQLVPVGEYEANLRKLVQRMQQTGAKIIFATTTPIPAGSAGRVEGVSYSTMRRRARDARDEGRGR